jgi:acyl dehydratase
MMGLFFEDIEPGAVYALGDYQFTDENIMRFTKRYAPVPFHMDDTAAAAGLFGRRSAVGFHICSAWMPCFVAANQKARDAVLKEGNPLPEIGAGFGLFNIKWFHPVFAGDRISFSTTVVAKRALHTKPRWGMFEVQNTGTRGDETVVQFTSKMLVAKQMADLKQANARQP